MYTYINHYYCFNKIVHSKTCFLKMVRLKNDENKLLINELLSFL